MPEGNSSVGQTYANMGLFLEKQQRWKEALEYLEKCMSIFKGSLGDAHPHTKRVTKMIDRVQSKVV